MTSIGTVLGAESNCNPSWNVLLSQIEDDYLGLQKLAQTIWASLPKLDTTQQHMEDFTQEAVVEVYAKIGAWDTARPAVPWASIVMRNRMLNLIRQAEAGPETDTLHDWEAPEHDPGYSRLELAPICERIRDAAKPHVRHVIDKIMRDEPLTNAERQRWHRFRQQWKNRELAHVG